MPLSKGTAISLTEKEVSAKKVGVILHMLKYYYVNYLIFPFLLRL